MFFFVEKQNLYKNKAQLRHVKDEIKCFFSLSPDYLKDVHIVEYDSPRLPPTKKIFNVLRSDVRQF